MAAVATNRSVSLIETEPAAWTAGIVAEKIKDSVIAAEQAA
jgi:hypothetical protein